MFKSLALEFHVSLLIQIPPPWKPEVENEWDTKYIPEEFAQESVHFTPGSHMMCSRLDPIAEDGQLPYFDQFSYQGSRNSYGNPSYLSTSSAAHSTQEMF